MSPEQIDEHIENDWSLSDYITWINEQNPFGFNLTSDLEHWAEGGITTASQLAEYLDKTCEDNCSE